MRRWERNGCAVHAELPFRFSVICSQILAVIKNVMIRAQLEGERHFEGTYIGNLYSKCTAYLRGRRGCTCGKIQSVRLPGLLCSILLLTLG